MKNTNLTALALLIALSLTSSAFANAKANLARFQKIYESTKKTDECSGGARIHPITFGDKGNEFSLMTFAQMGSITVGNNSQAYKLEANTGSVQVYANGKWKRVTHTVDPKSFLAQLKAMHTFMNQVLEIVQKNGKDKDVEQVNCSTKIIEYTQAEYSKSV